LNCALKIFNVKIAEIIKLTEARVIAGNPDKSVNIERAFSSDLMSDVLTLDDHQIVLITGLANVQLIRTVEMADIPVVLLARNKKADEEMIKLAEENGIVLLGTPYSIFRTSGILYENGLKPLY
jgi:predicted transcriptional regulator